MKRKIKHSICAVAILLSGIITAQEKNNEATTKETVTTEVKVNNGSEIKYLTKEVTTEKQNTLVLNKKDKNKVNQDFEVGPTKITETTITKDGDRIVSKEIETYYTQGNTKYTLEQSQKNIQYATGKIPEQAFTINDDAGEGIAYFTNNGDFCVEYRDKNSGTMQKDIYKKE